MTWYAAHIIVSYRTKSAKRILIHELVHLVSGETDDQAHAKAASIGQGYDAQDPSARLNGKPVVSKFEGIRKLISIQNDPPTGDDIPPTDGCEVTYSVMEIEERNLKKLVSGEPTAIRYED